MLNCLSVMGNLSENITHFMGAKLSKLKKISLVGGQQTT